MECPFCGKTLEYSFSCNNNDDDTLRWEAVVWCRVCGARSEKMIQPRWDVCKDDEDTIEWKWRDKG